MKVPTRHQRLLLGSRELQDSHRLSECGAGGTLELTLAISQHASDITEAEWRENATRDQVEWLQQVKKDWTLLKQAPSQVKERFSFWV